MCLGSSLARTKCLDDEGKHEGQANAHQREADVAPAGKDDPKRIKDDANNEQRDKASYLRVLLRIHGSSPERSVSVQFTSELPLRPNARIKPNREAVSA